MITTRQNLTEAQEQEYQDLFARMSEYTNKSVKDLHDYLAALDDLMKQMVSEPNANTYDLLRLPLTEPVFEINPDTREIVVPKQFKDNGLTIQGDKLAEIVWFQMPRFFDLTDFYNFKNDGVKTNSEFNDYHAYIEWYNPSAKLEEHQKGVDLAYAMTCDEDYIYFGWPLADKVAGEAGTIQFTVRFLGVKDRTIRYNFSTKIQSCRIQTTLNFDLLSGQYQADSWEDLIYSRPIYSGVVNSIESAAPVVIQGLPDTMMDLVETHHDAVGEEGDEDYVAAYDSYELPLEVKAAVPTSAKSGVNYELSFVWRQELEGMSGMADVTATNGGDKIGTKAIEVEGYTNAKQSTYTVAKVGRYTVLIGNKEEGKSTVRYVYTGVVEVPAPTLPILDNGNIPTRGYTDTVYRNQFSGEVLYNETVLTVDIKNAVEGDTPNYQWKREVVVGRENGQLVTTIENVPEADGGNSVTINPDKEGKYWVEVYTSRNGSESKVVDSTVADIRKPPQSFGGVPGSLTLTYNEMQKMFIASLDQENIAHKVKYIWYYSPLEGRTGSDNMPSFTQVQVGGSGSIKLNNNTFDVSQSGYYYAEAYEVVFDTEEDTTNAPYTSEAIFSQRAVSNTITITDNLTEYHASTDPTE